MRAFLFFFHSLERWNMFTSVLGIFTLALAALLFVKRYTRARKLPPGPMGLPLFGYYFFMGKNTMLKLHELSQKYGNVFGLYIGSQYIIVVDDWPTTKEVLNKTEILDRPDSSFLRVPYKFGVSGTNGHEWVQTRRLTARAIKEVGLGKVGWDELLQRAIQDWVQLIAEANGKPMDLNEFFFQRFVSIMMALILGGQFDPEDPIVKETTVAVNTMMQLTRIFAMANISPCLGNVLRLLGVEDADVRTESVKGLAKYVSKFVDSVTQDGHTAEKDSFIGQFLVESESQKKNAASFITDDFLKGNAMALLTSSGETTRSCLIWTLVAMAENPDKQQKVHEELDSVIGKNGVLKWGEQSRVPYTYAAQLETLRWRTLNPFINRKSTETFEINGYHVPKGTTFIFNTWAMHNDPKFWKDPEQFIPERFLLENGQRVDSSPESFNPFSFGKRGCFGKTIALKTTFLIFTALMQKFRVVQTSSAYDINLGLTYQPRNVKLCFIPR